MNNEEIMQHLVETEQRCKSNSHRLDELAGQIEAVNSLAATMQVMASEQKHQAEAIQDIKTDINDVGKKVDAIEKLPGKRWEAVVEKVILLVVAAVVGYVLAHVGL